MNIHQEQLISLLKEVDAFCREHGITYYCAGGTVIGAARHRGFIPWDDDIDIYMTRSEFARFDEALRRYGPEDRKLEYFEADNERNASVARYHKETGTMFVHFNLLGRSSAGISLDVFVLDPIPDSYEERVDYLARLFAYSDITTPCHVYSHRLPVEKFDIYDKYKKIADEEGRARAVELISDEIFSHDVSECREYCLRWGSIPLIYPADVIGRPVYLPFEDMMIPVPQDWYMYLVIHYGMDWADLPYAETHREHVNIVHYDVKYDYFYEIRDGLYSQDRLMDMHFSWKDAERDFYRAAAPADSFVLDVRNRICRAEMEKKLRGYGASSVKELFDKGDFGAVTGVFAPYLELQLSHAYMGRRMRHGTQFRWLFPYIMPLSEEELDVLLTVLIKSGKQSTAEKITGIYRRADMRSEAVEKAAAVIDVINQAGRHYYMGNYEECLEVINSFGGFEDVPALADFRCLSLAQTGMDAGQEKELEAAAGQDECRDALRKAWGDLLWKHGRCDEAAGVYRELMRSCRNGFFWLDIHDKLPDIPPIPTKNTAPFSDNDLTRTQMELLGEIAQICVEQGIRYVLAPDLGARLYHTGNIGHMGGTREVFMDEEGAERFAAAVQAAGIKGRRLLSWKDSSRVRDHALIYMDSESVYCDFRQLGKWKDMGISVTIRILKSGKDLSSLKWRLLGRDADGRRGSAGDLCWYSNIRGKRPVRHVFRKSLWESTVTCEAGGKVFRISAEAAEPGAAGDTDPANVPPITSIYTYRSSGMSWKEIAPLIDEDAYRALDWKAFNAARDRFRSIDKEVRECWQRMLDIDEKLDMADIPDKYRC